MHVADKIIRRARLEFFSLIERTNELIRGDYWLFVGITTVGYLIGTLVPLYILYGPMLCGIFLAFRNKQQGQPVAFDNLFRGFDWFLPSLLVSLAFAGVMLVITFPLSLIFVFVALGLQHSGGGMEENWGWFIASMGAFYPLILVLVSIVFAIFLYACPLIMDRGLSASEALSASWRGFWTNLWGTFKIAVCCGFLVFLGMMCCYVGVFFILPHVFGVIWLTYQEVFEEPIRGDSASDPLAS